MRPLNLVASGFLKSCGMTFKRYSRKMNWVVVPRNRFRILWMRSPWRNAPDFLGLGKLFWDTTKHFLEFSQGGYTTGAYDTYLISFYWFFSLPPASWSQFPNSYWDSYSFCRNSCERTLTQSQMATFDGKTIISDIYWHGEAGRINNSISTIQSLAHSSQIPFSWDL